MVSVDMDGICDVMDGKSVDPSYFSSSVVVPEIFFRYTRNPKGKEDDLYSFSTDLQVVDR